MTLALSCIAVVLYFIFFELREIEHLLRDLLKKR